jgi:hypothetical protein
MRLHHALLPVPVIAASGVAVSAVACGDAPQTVECGAPLFDAVVSVNADGGTCVPSSATNATWTSLYADFFGPTGIAQCGDTQRAGNAGTSSCHHDGTGSGAIASGFICGDTQESCWQGITSPNAVFVSTRVVVPCSPGESYVMQVLRQDGGGIMPFYPESVVFSDDDMNRIRTWIAAGAQND